MPGKTSAEHIEHLFQENIRRIFDKVIETNDPQHGERRVFQLWGHWYAIADLDCPRLGLGVYFRTPEDLECYFISVNGTVDFSDPALAHSNTEHKALYVSPNPVHIDPVHFQLWLCKQIDRAFDIAKERPQTGPPP